MWESWDLKNKQTEANQAKPKSSNKQKNPNQTKVIATSIYIIDNSFEINSEMSNGQHAHLQGSYFCCWRDVPFSFGPDREQQGTLDGREAAHFSAM